MERQQGKAQGLAESYEGRVGEMTKRLLELEGKVEELMRKIEEAVGHATEACERMETTRDPKSIEREMAKLQQKVREKGPGWVSFGMVEGMLGIGLRWCAFSRLAEKQEVQQRYVEVADRCKTLGDDITGFKRAHKVCVCVCVCVCVYNYFVHTVSLLAFVK